MRKIILLIILLALTSCHEEKVIDGFTVQIAGPGLATLALIASATGTGVSMYQSHQQQKAAQEQAEYQADVAEAQAKSERLAAIQDAEQMAKRRRAKISEFTTMQAGTGTELSGSPLLALEDLSLELSKDIEGAYSQRLTRASQASQQGILYGKKASSYSPGMAAATAGLQGVGNLGSQYASFKGAGLLE